MTVERDAQTGRNAIMLAVLLLPFERTSNNMRQLLFVHACAKWLRETKPTYTDLKCVHSINTIDIVVLVTDMYENIEFFIHNRVACRRVPQRGILSPDYGRM